MPKELPFPIAFLYHLVGAARDTATRCERVLRCYEMVVRYCAAVQISDYVGNGCPNSELNRKLLERLGRAAPLGQWIELVREIARLQQRGVFEPFMPELARFYFGKRQAKAVAREAEVFDGLLCSARNQWAHPDRSWSEADYAQHFKENKRLLDELLGHLEFLADYTLYVPYRGPRRDTVSEALVLMGPADPPRLETELELRLSTRVQEHLEYEMTAFLAVRDDPARQLLLCPLSVFANRDGAEDIFLFDGGDFRNASVRRLFYRAVRVGQRPLEVFPGSDYGQLVRQFGGLVQLLGIGPPAADDVPPKEDLQAHYFSAQRDVIEEHTRHFVGRSYAEAALDRFLTTHSRGYFVISSGPGQGKTALCCHLAQTRPLVHHFVNRTGGRSDGRLILRSLIAQLAATAGLVPSLPEDLAALTKLWEDLLARTAATGKQVVVLVDALDELPADAGQRPPFLAIDGLPNRVYFVVSVRPGDRLEQLAQRLANVPLELYALGPMERDEARGALRAWQPAMSDREAQRIVAASQGNPLYLRALADELDRNPDFGLHELPAGVQSLFRRSVADLRANDDAAVREVLGLLAVARAPLSLRELSQITGRRQRQVFESGIRPVRQFLSEIEGGYCFYHEKFHEFVTREVVYEDELPDFHRLLVAWLRRPENDGCDYRCDSLAHHLFHCGDMDELLRTIDAAFLETKVRRFGYAVLEDVELLVRAMLAAGDPGLVEQCVGLVEGLRAVAGGDLLEKARLSVKTRGAQSPQTGCGVLSRTATVLGIQVAVGQVPKAEVGADFFDVVPFGRRLLVAVGDAPGTGLKGAFVARFVGSLLRKSASEMLGGGSPAELLRRLNEVLVTDAYFENISLLCVAVDPQAGIAQLASAGHPYPVLYAAREGRCRRLPVRGDLLHSPFVDEPGGPRFEDRSVEIDPGDLLVLVTDGLIEAHKLSGDPYGYRFTKIVEQMAQDDAEEIVQAILADWTAHSAGDEYKDDVTVMLVKMPREGRTSVVARANRGIGQ